MSSYHITTFQECHAINEEKEENNCLFIYTGNFR